MNERIRELVGQIGKLERERVTALHAQEAQALPRGLWG